MVFSSLVFLYAFLPATLLVYFLVPKVLKNGILFLFSLVFYAWGEPRYLPLILLSIAQGYGIGLLIARCRSRKWAKFWLAVSIVLSLGILACFKYADFAISTINSVFRADLPLWHLALPVGISFYTFQILSYTVDVYRGDVQAQRNPIHFGAYVVFFPQLIAGPIVRYADIAQALENRKTTLDGAYAGMVRFFIGLGKKVLLANQLGSLYSAYGDSAQPSVLFAWLSAIAYMLQIYFDFSGYSDMALGMGKIFGFDFPENFRYPYVARSITDFWRRWHMSLSTWFRDYVYIPLGGNRVRKLLWIRNIFIVWCLTGLWHGAGWNFLLWGLFFFFFLLAEKLWYGAALERHPGLGHGYVLLAVLLGFVLFAGETMTQVWDNLEGMFGLGGLPAWTVESVYYLRSSLILLAVSCIGATPLPARLYRRLSASTGGPVLAVLQPVALVLILLLSTAFLVDGSFNPFLYFRF